MRLFIGIGLSSEVSAVIARIREKLAPASGPDLRWSAPEGWHITVQFLGRVNDDQAACVLQQLKSIRAVPVPVRIEGVGFFERAGVFWAGVSITPELLALQQIVTASMRQCGFLPEDRPYSPHITLARAKGRTVAKALAPLKRAVAQHKTQLRAECTAEEFLLYESFPGSEGSRYEVRARFSLNPAP
ncbi:MAG: RNA 2',3'-cyclic phosphodiesterase [Acidobacteriota bacterium]